MTTLNERQFRMMAESHEGRCLSIYLPTHSSGQEVLHQEDQKRLKNLVKRIEIDLERWGYSQPNINHFLAPLASLLRDNIFWRNRTKSLALFLTVGGLQTVDLSYKVEMSYFLAHDYYLRPLLPLLSHESSYFVLTLNKQEIKFYRGNRENLEMIEVPDLPQRVEDVVGADYRESTIGYHRQKIGGNSYTIYHGKGEWQEDQKDELLELFRSLDQKILPILNKEQWPLFVVASRVLFAIYREACRFPRLYPEPIAIDPRFLTSKDLLIEVKKYTDPLNDAREVHANLIRQYQFTPRTAFSWAQVIPAAVAGQVEALFIQNTIQCWGVFDRNTFELRIQDEPNVTNTSLDNLAAIQVYLHGGNVYDVSSNQMPLEGHEVIALMRY